MKDRTYETFDEPIDPPRLKAFVRSFLRLPAHANDAEILAALRARDDGLHRWYDARLRAVEDYHQR